MRDEQLDLAGGTVKQRLVPVMGHLRTAARVLAPDVQHEDGSDEDERHDEHGNGSTARRSD